MAVVLLITVGILLFLLRILVTRKYNYWKNKKVPHPPPVPLFGNYAQYILLRKFSVDVVYELCKQFANEPYFGTYFGTEPALVIQDPELIKLVFTKDFYYFNSRELQDYTNKEVITQNLFFTSGDPWKVMRQNLTPLFSAAKLKKMFYLIDKCAHSFEKLLDREMLTSDVVEARSMMARFTMDCITSCAFGVEANTLNDDCEKNPFTIMGKEIFATSYYRGFKTVARAMWPKLFYGVGLQTFPSEIVEFFHKLLVDVFKSRDYKPSPRNDFVDLVLNFYQSEYLEGEKITNFITNEHEKVKLKMTDELLVAQCVVFFAAGFETSSSALSLTLYELAKDQAAQTKAIAEVDEYLKKHNNKLEFECIKELPYLDACLTEVLRLYPVLGIITREVAADYTFPSGLKVERGTRVHVPSYYIHRLPENFPEPEKYKPERFLPGAPEIKPYTFFPFGEGPRFCIGMRFAKMQSLPGLITVLKKYRVELADGTPEKLTLAPTTLLLQPAELIKLKFTPREGWEKRLLD